MVSRRQFLLTTAGLMSGAVGVGAYTRYYEPQWLDIARRVMPIRDLPGALVGKRLVQLSDIHVGPMVPDDYVLDTFNQVRALEPDIVVYTGDFTSHHPGLLAHAEFIYSQMPLGQIGTVASLGNHDYGVNWAHPEDADRISGVLRNLGVTVLVNAMTDIDGLQIVGLGDLWSRQFFPDAAFAEVAPNSPTIALSHNPDTVDMTGWQPFSGWILSGHTHGGQCKPPFLPPPVLPVKNKRYTNGVFALSHDRQMYISRGVGTVLPVRFNVRPEVTVFTLSAA
ncbi:MAG: metallophosphoesterase [Gemmatimonadaceae bacterium]|nr:metallophosphoesterase [Gemmatimonadaceae bacterium]